MAHVDNVNTYLDNGPMRRAGRVTTVLACRPAVVLLRAAIPTWRGYLVGWLHAWLVVSSSVKSYVVVKEFPAEDKASE